MRLDLPSITTYAALALAASTLAAPGEARAADVDFLVPGVSVGSVHFEEGAAVSYLVISEAHGIRDTSMVSLEVLRSKGDDIELQINSSDWPVSQDETVSVLLRLCPGASSASSTGEFLDCVKKILVREGSGDYREPTPEEIDDFRVERLFMDRKEGTEETMTGEEEISVPAGTFECDVYEQSATDSSRMDLGGFQAVRTESEKSVLHISSSVPFWGLVRSRVERSVVTEYSPGSPAPSSRPRLTVTESVLNSFTRPSDSR